MGFLNFRRFLGQPDWRFRLDHRWSINEKFVRKSISKRIFDILHFPKDVMWEMWDAGKCPIWHTLPKSQIAPISVKKDMWLENTSFDPIWPFHNKKKDCACIWDILGDGRYLEISEISNFRHDPPPKRGGHIFGLKIANFRDFHTRSKDQTDLCWAFPKMRLHQLFAQI